MEISPEYGYWGLFVASFVAATIIPFSSEALLAALILGSYDPVLCVLIASVGNTLGGMSSYYLGYIGKWTWLKRFFGVKEEKMERWKTNIDYYGAYTALLCWLPVVGDVIAVALGFFRVRALPVVIFMLAGKTIRYIFLALMIWYGWWIIES